MSFLRTMLIALAAVFTLAMISVASACCDGVYYAPVVPYPNSSHTDPRGSRPHLGRPLEWRMGPTKFIWPLGRLLWRRPNPPSLGSAVAALCCEPGT